MQYEFHIPISPVAKGRPRFSRARGVAYTPAKTRQAENDVRYFLSQKFKEQPLESALQLDVTFFIRRPPSVKAKKRPHVTVNPDLDNYLKLVLDASNGYLWQDDAQIIRLSASKLYSDRDSIYMCVQEVTT